MASILRPFSNILAPGIQQVPVGTLTIDFTNPLTRGLVSCFVPGVSGGVDLCGTTLTLAAGSAANLSGLNQEGVGLSSTAANGGLSATVGTSGYPITGMTSATLWWRGLQSSATVASSTYISLSDSGGSYIFSMLADSINSNVVLQFNTAGTFHQVTQFAVPAANTFLDLIAIFDLGAQTDVIYKNGVQQNLNGAYTAAPTYTATTQLGINTDPHTNVAANSVCNIAGVWNRAFTASDVLALYTNPYGFLVPSEYDLSEIRLAPTIIPELQNFNAFVGRRVAVIGY